MSARRLIDVVGVSFVDDYPANLLRLRDLHESRLPNAERFACVLRRNPANQYDPNAVEVHVPILGSMIGHVPKDLAAELAPIMDAGVPVAAEVVDIRVNPDHPDRPGCSIAVRRVEELAP